MGKHGRTDERAEHRNAKRVSTTLDSLLRPICSVPPDPSLYNPYPVNRQDLVDHLWTVWEERDQSEDFDSVSVITEEDGTNVEYEIIEDESDSNDDDCEPIT